MQRRRRSEWRGFFQPGRQEEPCVPPRVGRQCWMFFFRWRGTVLGRSGTEWSGTHRLEGMAYGRLVAVVVVVVVVCGVRSGAAETGKVRDLLEEDKGTAREQSQKVA